MNEKLLQFIWQFQHFSQGELRTTDDEPLQIIFPGNRNLNQGPDFLDAKLRIGETTWAGTIELHVKSSDWEKHGHTGDNNYDNVILHVVWSHDSRINRFPTFELCSRVPGLLLDRYEELLRINSFIPCEKSITRVPSLTWTSWKERLLAERLLRKSSLIQDILLQNNFHWEQTFWWLLSRNFGYKVNADAFEMVARSIPLAVLQRQKKQVLQLEALLLGQAGLLNGHFAESYPKMLQKEYRYQQKKHLLRPILMPVHFLRMRPGNFPTLRLAQLAMLLHSTDQLFTTIRETQDIATVRVLFDVIANDYWHYHYRFDEESSFSQKRVGKTMVDNIIINTICPLLFSYGNYHNENIYKQRALGWLEEVVAEENRIVSGFSRIGVTCKTAYDSQSLIEMKTQYCDARRCLECSVGNSLLTGICDS